MSHPVQPANEADEKPDVALEALASEEEDSLSGPIRYELLTYPADFTVEVLHQKWRSAEISIPVLQRRFVWSQSQSSRLIESFLRGLPVPGIFLYAEKGTEKLLVVDGQQRLRSLFYFFEETFGEEKEGKKTVFRLSLERENPWHGKTFSDLREEDARRLKNSVLRAFIMKQVSPDDDTSIYHVFERLNTGGTLLTPQEVRNSIYDGPFNSLLHKLNKLQEWRDILGQPIPDRRLRDVELILRFLSLYKASDRYEKPMKDFMNRFMKRHRDGDLNPELEDVFPATATAVLARLGPRPFHLKAGLNPDLKITQATRACSIRV